MRAQGVDLAEVGRVAMRAELDGWRLNFNLLRDLASGEGSAALDRYLASNEGLLARVIEEWRVAGVAYPLLAMTLLSFVTGLWMGKRWGRG